MKETALNPLRIDGKDYPVYVTEAGVFFHKLKDGDTVKAKSLRELEKLLQKTSRMNRLVVPATRLEVPGWRSERNKGLTITHGTLTGVHAGNGRLLWKAADGETDTLGSHDHEVCRRLTDEEVTRLHALWAAKVEAEEAWETAKDDVYMNGTKALEEAGGEA